MIYGMAWNWETKGGLPVTQSLELLHVGANVFLVKASWRSFPSFAMQVDTLHNLATEVESLRALLEQGNFADVSEGLEGLSESLRSWVSYVSQYCESNAIELPVNFRSQLGASR
jgi:hypothetical protein